jgi:putative spermidine/putrescine transport system substrate-binding protein
MKVEQQRPSIDIYYSSPITEIRGMEEGLYAPLDPAIVTNLSRLYDVARLPKNLGVRIELTDVGILYNKKIYDEKKIPHPRTWADIWHPAVAGHVILGDTSSFYTVSYIAFLNKMMGGKEDDPTPAIKHIASQKQKLLAIVRTYPERIQFLTTGQAWLTVDGGETSLPEIEKNPDLGFVSPREGAPLFWHSLHVVKGAPNPIGAQLLINFMISEDVQAEFAKKGFMGPVNKAVKLSPEMARMVPYGPEGVARLTELNNLAISQSLEKYRQEWAARVVGDKK